MIALIVLGVALLCLATFIGVRYYRERNGGYSVGRDNVPPTYENGDMEMSNMYVSLLLMRTKTDSETQT